MTFSALTLVVLVIACGGGLALGWTARRAFTSRQDADLKRAMYESKGAIPQLEASVRTRDQRIANHQTDIATLRSRITTIEAALVQKEADIVKRDRDVRRLNSELAIVKDGSANEGALHPHVELVEGVTEEAIAPASAPDAAARLKKIEARYEALKRGLIARDDRVAELEEQLRKSPSHGLESELDALNDSKQVHMSELAARDATVKSLEARLQQEIDQRAQLETLAKRRTETNRELKDKVIKAEHDLPKLMNALKARDAVVTERDATIRALSGQLDHVTTERASRDHTIVELERTILVRGEDLQQRAARVVSLQASLTAGERRIETLTHELTVANREIQKAHGTVRERDATLAANALRTESADALAREHDQAMESLKSALRDREFRIDNLSTDLLKAAATLDALQNANVGANSSSASLEGKLAAESKTARDRIEALTRHNEKLQNEVTVKERRQLESQKECVRLTERVTALESTDGNQMRVLESQLATARQRCERSENELLEAAREAKAMRVRMRELEKKLGSGEEGEAIPPSDVPVLNDVAMTIEFQPPARH